MGIQSDGPRSLFMKQFERRRLSSEDNEFPFDRLALGTSASVPHGNALSEDFRNGHVRIETPTLFAAGNPPLGRNEDFRVSLDVNSDVSLRIGFVRSGSFRPFHEHRYSLAGYSFAIFCVQNANLECLCQ